MQSQLAVCKQRIDAGKAPRPRFSQAFRILWVILPKRLDRWEDLAQVMKPATVKKWHRAAFRLYWRWKSRPGRPEVEPEMQALIRRLSTENPLWGAARIGQQLRLLGYEPPCTDTILKYMVKPRQPREPSATWLPFLHAPHRPDRVFRGNTPWLEVIRYGCPPAAAFFSGTCTSPFTTPLSSTSNW